MPTATRTSVQGLLHSTPGRWCGMGRAWIPSLGLFLTPGMVKVRGEREPAQARRGLTAWPAGSPCHRPPATSSGQCPWHSCPQGRGSLQPRLRPCTHLTGTLLPETQRDPVLPARPLQSPHGPQFATHLGAGAPGTLARPVRQRWAQTTAPGLPLLRGHLGLPRTPPPPPPAQFSSPRLWALLSPELQAKPHSSACLFPGRGGEK